MSGGGAAASSSHGTTGSQQVVMGIILFSDPSYLVRSGSGVRARVADADGGADGPDVRLDLLVLRRNDRAAAGGQALATAGGEAGVALVLGRPGVLRPAGREGDRDAADARRL